LSQGVGVCRTLVMAIDRRRRGRMTRSARASGTTGVSGSYGRQLCWMVRLNPPATPIYTTNDRITASDVGADDNVYVIHFSWTSSHRFSGHPVCVSGASRRAERGLRTLAGRCLTCELLTDCSGTARHSCLTGPLQVYARTSAPSPA